MTPPNTSKARIEVFRTGTFTPMEGAAITYTAADMKAIGDIYDRATAPAPIVIGHPKTDAPAYGWADSFEYDASSDRLLANLSEINPAFAEAVRSGAFKKVSMSFFRPEEAANPVPGSWYPKHIGFLGGAAPAVSGLANVQFSASAGVTFTNDFGDPGFEQAAGLFRGLRDFLIDKFGLDDADKALPTFQIDWLGETETMPAVQPDFTARPTWSPVLDTRPRHALPKHTKEEPSLTHPNPSFAAREAALAQGEADYTARNEALMLRQRDLNHTEHVAFAEGLITAGKLLPLSKDKVVALLDAMPIDVSVSFAAGDTTTTLPAAKMLREILEAQPKAVSFGRMDLPAAPTDQRAASFASDGQPVDTEQLAIHQKALAYVREHPGTEYLAAVAAVS